MLLFEQGLLIRRRYSLLLKPGKATAPAVNIATKELRKRDAFRRRWVRCAERESSRTGVVLRYIEDAALEQ